MRETSTPTSAAPVSSRTLLLPAPPPSNAESSRAFNVLKANMNAMYGSFRLRLVEKPAYSDWITAKANRGIPNDALHSGAPVFRSIRRGLRSCARTLSVSIQWKSVQSIKPRKAPRPNSVQTDRVDVGIFLFGRHGV